MWDTLPEQLNRALSRLAEWQARMDAAADRVARDEAETRVRFYTDLIAELRALLARPR